MIDDTKIIKISGTHNKYMIKIANKQVKEKVKRSFMNKNELSEEHINHFLQLNYLQEIQTDINIIDKNRTKIFMKQELERKINNYKNQDIIKDIYDEHKFIYLPDVINKLIGCSLKCYYCSCEVLILYNNVREKYQWTIDRINNVFGHNNDNYVIACLNCNLTRRKQNIDKFLFTKNLNVIKSNVV